MALLGLKPRSAPLGKTILSALGSFLGSLIVTPGGTEWFAKETLTIDSTSGGKTLTRSVYGTLADVAHIDVQVAAIRYWLDGSEPSTTSGNIAEVGDIITLENHDEIEKFRAIEDTTTDATIVVSYGRN